MGWITPLEDEEINIEHLRISEKSNIDLTINDHVIVSDFSYIPVPGLIIAV